MNKMDSKRYLRQLVHAMCWGGASTLALGTFVMSDSAAAAAAAAADTSAPADELSEIVVTGIRASLQASLDIKRNSDGIVDAISAEDIGKFPDANLADAMERIPGVTVSRSSMALGSNTGSVSSNGAGAQITVRGFGPEFNETLFDGRQVPTAIGNRGFDFGALGSDFVGQIDVMKTPDSTLSAGAIGATINIKYPKPFDHPGLQLAGTLSGNDNQGENKIKPNGGVLFSDTFADDRFGVLADFAFNETKTRSSHINIQGWEGQSGDGNNGLNPCQLAGAAAPCPGGPPSGTPKGLNTVKDWFIQDYGIYQEHTDDKKLGGRVVLQAKPMDGLEITIDDNWSQEKTVQNQYGFSVWFNNGQLSNVSQAPDGTITSFTQDATPTDFQAQLNQSETRLNTLGFNVKWDASEHTTYMFDAYNSVAKLLPLVGVDADVGYGNGPYQTNLGLVVPGGKNLPYPVNYGPAGDTANFSNPAFIGSHVLVESYNQNEDIINQFKLEGKWADDNLKFKYGVQFTHEHYVLRSYTDLPFTWQTYAGYGPPPFGSGGVAPIPANLISNTFSTGSNFIHGWGDGNLLPATFVAANAISILNYLQGLNGVGRNGANDTTHCSNNTTGVPCTGQYIMYPNTGAFQDIIESTVSPYVSLTSSTKIGDMPLKINVGARLEDTHTKSVGNSALPFGQLFILVTDHTAYGFPGVSPQSPIFTENNYRYLLPNLDLNLNITDSVKARLDVSRTLTRPAITLLTPDLNIPSSQRVGGLVGTGGNPNLLPYLSDNVDLGAEWYYAKNSYVSADVFVKEVTNFIVGGTVQQAINNITLPDGSKAIFSITSRVNGPAAEVRGLELAWQYTIGDSGFGFLANATFVGTDKPYNPNDLSVSGFAISGLANSYNFIPFFDKYGFQARLAINHRAEYLDHFGQLQNGSQFGTEPTFVDAATYLDFSTSYDFNRHFSVYFTADNLTDQIYSTHGRFKEQVLDVADSGRLFTLGVHMKF